MRIWVGVPSIGMILNTPILRVETGEEEKE